MKARTRKRGKQETDLLQMGEGREARRNAARQAVPHQIQVLQIGQGRQRLGDTRSQCIVAQVQGAEQPDNITRAQSQQ